MTFFVELWESVFTPGPTPVVLRATNLTFLALQAVLALLLFATHSVHFVVLSVLCAGLWRSINWFAAELAAAQEREKTEAAGAGAAGKGRAMGVGAEDSDTEVEGETRVGRPRHQQQRQQQQERQQEQEHEQHEHLGSEGVRRRGIPAGGEREAAGSRARDAQSSVSTEDEWERVSESEDKH